MVSRSRSGDRFLAFMFHVLFFIYTFESVIAWSADQNSIVRPQHKLAGTHVLQSSGASDTDRQCNEGPEYDRRRFLSGGASAAAAALSVAGIFGSNSPALAIPAATQERSNVLTVPNLRCLTDLPPITPGCVRIYLCRHGQTENNRLRKVQGARIDPSLNVYGSEMAARIGMALSYLPDDLTPTVAVHSKLARARETAQIASKTLCDIRSSKRGRRAGEQQQPDPASLIDAYGTPSIVVPSTSELGRIKMKLDTLESLGEVDFGTGYDGMSVEAVRAGMYATYGSWAVGMIDRRMDGEGESGREVLTRGVNALQSLADIAKHNGGTVLAVSHSTYLRTMLGAVMEVPLAQAATAEQKNGCINVLDVNVEGATTTLGPKSSMFGGSMSIVKDFSLVLPQTTVVRMNEFRHLEGITWPTAEES